MAEPGTINFSATRLQHLQGAFDTKTGKITDFGFVDATALGVRGNLSEGDLKKLQDELRKTSGADTTAIQEKVAERADGTKKAELPEGYKSGRYTEAKTDADLREGFRGGKVTEFQQKLKDLGYDLGDGGKDKNGVDGYWGPKTQKAYEAYMADTGTGKKADAAKTTDGKTADAKTVDGKKTDATGTPRQETIDSVRNEANTRSKYGKVEDPAETAKELAQDIRAGNTDDINKTLTNTRNADMKKIDANMPRDANGNYTTALAGDRMNPFGVDGNDADYADLGNRMLKGNRNEGADAAANGKVVDEYAKRLLEAREQPGIGRYLPSFMDGTDENKMNDVFATASGAQLRELDRRFKEGIKDDAGNVVKYDDGLRGYIKSEIGDGAHQKLLLDQLNRPLR
jgi:hypothetical protein